MLKKRLNKYKSIIFSVVIFILLDISVLVFSFYISYQISQNAAEINLAGRQRTLSQRITKNLLEFERTYNKSRPYDVIVADIEESMYLFDSTLSAFDVGGEAVIDDRVVSIEAITDPAGRQAIEVAKPMWEIYKNYTADVLGEFKGRFLLDENLVTVFFRESIVKNVVNYTTHNNIELLDVMNDLTESIEYTASKKVEKLRFAQAVAIILAVINFIFIMFFSLKKLRRADEELTFAKAEMDVMLNTMTEGMFLLDKDLRVSEYYSKEMEVIFNMKSFSGLYFPSVLQSVCAGFNVAGVENFLNALFDNSKKMKVLNVLNPLQEVQASILKSDSSFLEQKHLKFSYSRVKNDGRIDRVLVKVTDISHDILHEKVRHEEKRKQFKYLRTMTALMSTNKEALPDLFQQGLARVSRARLLLSDYATTKKINIDDMLIVFDDIYSESKRLSFDSLLVLIEDFNHHVAALDKNVSAIDAPYMQVIVALDNLHLHIESMYELSCQISFSADSHIADNLTHSSVSNDRNSQWSFLNEFANDVAFSEHKSVRVSLSGLADHIFPEKMVTVLKSIIVQVFYHSILLSVEDQAERRRLQKPNEAILDVRLVKKSNGGYCLTIKNDGAGVDLETLRASVVAANRISGADANVLDFYSLLFYSYVPNTSTSLSSIGKIFSGEELKYLTDRIGVKFHLRSVPTEGSVFEFVLPSIVSSQE